MLSVLRFYSLPLASRAFQTRRGSLVWAKEKRQLCFCTYLIYRHGCHPYTTVVSGASSYLRPLRCCFLLMPTSRLAHNSLPLPRASWRCSVTARRVSSLPTMWRIVVFKHRRTPWSVSAPDEADVLALNRTQGPWRSWRFSGQREGWTWWTATFSGVHRVQSNERAL